MVLSFKDGFPLLYSNILYSQSSDLVYNNAMKKTLLTSLIAILAFVAPVFAENPAKTDLAASAQGGTKEVTPEIKPVVLTKKQKTEADLRSTSHRLSLVVDRTQALLDLLTKKNKDTSDAQTALDKTSALLEEANSAIDQFAGILPPATNDETQIDETAVKPKVNSVGGEVVIFKDPLKKAQESLKSAKASLLESISILKNILTQKETAE